MPRMYKGPGQRPQRPLGAAPICSLSLSHRPTAVRSMWNWASSLSRGLIMLGVRGHRASDAKEHKRQHPVPHRREEQLAQRLFKQLETEPPRIVY